MLVWGIWGFFVVKKIEDQNRFFRYKTTNNIIYEVKDIASFILRFLQLDLLLWLRYSDGKYNKVIKFLTVSFVLRRGGGYLGIFWAGMCRPGRQIGTPF